MRFANIENRIIFLLNKTDMRILKLDYDAL